MPVNRNTDPYGGRFASDPTGGSVLAGYQQATDKLDRDLVKRNIKPYAKYGFEQSLSELAGMTDQKRYEMATKAVLAKNKVGVKPKKSAPKTTKPKKAQPRRTPVKPKASPKPRVAPKPKAPTKRQRVNEQNKLSGQRRVTRPVRKHVPPKVTKPKTPPPAFGRPPVRV